MTAPARPARSASDVLADLAALAARQAALTAELASALSTLVAPPACPVAATPEYLTTAEAATLLGVSTRHLERLRRQGSGPRFVRVGNAIRYVRDAVRLPSGEGPETPSVAPVV